jgi:Viral BACON domain/Fibronectin type III domain
MILRQIYPRHPYRGYSLLLPLVIWLFVFFPFPQSAQAAQITLAWNPNAEPDLAGYMVNYGTVSGNYQVYMDVGNITQATITNLQDGGTYYFAVTAYNVSGIESGYSNEVSYTASAACTYSLSPTSQSAGSSGVSGAVSVTTSSGCTWAAVSNASWITITSNNSVTGAGTLNYSVSANSGTASRTGTLTIAGRAFTVTQSGSSGASGGSSSGSWTFCADEGQRCSFTGTKNVRYGANGVYVYKSLTNGTACSNSVFGDPLKGADKQCYIQASGTFTLTASAGSGGAISPSQSVQIASGGSQTFTITPSNGYQVASILVDGVNMGALTTYTFSNVTANHTISVSFTSSSGSWTFCADEDQRCSFTGTKNVRYGLNGVYVYKSLTNGTACSNSVFGDPLRGADKQCYIQ